MEGYYFDPHIHTREVSPCGNVPAEQMVKLYREAGYAGVCVTDHYYDGYFKSLGDITWKEKVEHYRRGYCAARELGEKLGLCVLFGQEMRFLGHPNDFLTYGLDERDLLENPELYRMPVSEFLPFAHEHGAIVFQAHPFRLSACAPSNPAYIDGVEVYNGHPDHDSRNNLAEEFADSCGLLRISGSDFHRCHHLARGGLILPRIPKDGKDFAAMLRGGEVERLVRT
ncbi:MAG: transposase [Clostridiaceae bacterium]|nr:transposase [Clostridiaceae bacterium]